MERVLHFERSSHPAPLSGCEGVVLALVLLGASNQRTALELGIRSSTVSSHLRSVRRKLNATVPELLVLGPAVERLLALLAPAEAVPTSVSLRVPLAAMTFAERHIVKLVAAGFSSARVAALRGTSVRTVTSQLDTLYRRYAVTSRRELLLRLYGSSLPPVTRSGALRLLRLPQAS